MAERSSPTTEQVESVLDNTMKETKMDMYFKTIVENLPGGISVIRCESDGSMVLEYVSEGFAEMTQMSLEETWDLYKKDIYAGVHPDDQAVCRNKVQEYIQNKNKRCEMTFRLIRGDGGYVWVKSVLSVIKSPDGICRIYSSYNDISKNMEEKEQLRSRYEDIILQHYRKPGPDELILGHCNITKDFIIEIWDHTNSDLLENFGSNRTDFFISISSLIVDEKERQTFLGMYLNEPALAAFHRNETEHILKCFIKLPKETQGRYVQFKVNLIETPDTGDVTGVLTVTDITEETISDRILHQISVTSHEYVIDVDLDLDSYRVVICNKASKFLPPPTGCHSRQIAHMLETAIAPKDRERYSTALNAAEIRRRLKKVSSYTFSYSIIADSGEIFTRNMTVFSIDLRLGRVCLVNTDITESVREEQGLLNMMAYTFELMGNLNIGTGRFTMYTREAVLKNLSPYTVENYEDEIDGFAKVYGMGEEGEELQKEFYIETILERLSEQPAGYDFVFPHRSEAGLRYKQINVLWGDENHSTVCMVRADVTDMLTSERKAKQELKRALELAEEANRAKSDFLSTMSHDIRTPMNAIMGMTTLALANMDNRERLKDCLHKISISNKHLLSLINDILDMSKIEQSVIPLNHMPIYLGELIEQLTAIIMPQAREAGLQLNIQTEGVTRRHFYGDPLRINQVLINLLSNAVKFTPEGGKVDFIIEEITPQKGSDHVRYQFTVRDTGIGMSEEFLTDLFAPFARSRTAAQIEGTGLGLSITKGLVDIMGGRISVESCEKKGSAFRVELECEEVSAGEYDDEKGFELSGSAKETILGDRNFLVAEDNELNAEILCELLNMEGAGAVRKRDGSQTVQAFLEAAPNTYDAVLMDIQMPIMNGYEAARAIRSSDRPDAKTIPIIAMTANAFSEDIQAALNAGMNAHVAKPIDMKLLRNALSGCL